MPPLDNLRLSSALLTAPELDVHDLVGHRPRTTEESGAVTLFVGHFA